MKITQLSMKQYGAIFIKQKPKKEYIKRLISTSSTSSVQSRSSKYKNV